MSARRGQTVNLSLRLSNNTTASAPRSTATASAPAALHLGGPSSLKISSLKAGERRTVQLPLNVGGKAELGRYTVKVELQIGGRTATRTATLVIVTIRGLLLDLLTTGDRDRIQDAADSFLAALVRDHASCDADA